MEWHYEVKTIFGSCPEVAKPLVAGLAIIVTVQVVFKLIFLFKLKKRDNNNDADN